MLEQRVISYSEANLAYCVLVTWWLLCGGSSLGSTRGSPRHTEQREKRGKAGHAQRVQKENTLPGINTSADLWRGEGFSEALRDRRLFVVEEECETKEHLQRCGKNRPRAHAHAHARMTMYIILTRWCCVGAALVIPQLPTSTLFVHCLRKSDAQIVNCSVWWFLMYLRIYRSSLSFLSSPRTDLSDCRPPYVQQCSSQGQRQDTRVHRAS